MLSHYAYTKSQQQPTVCQKVDTSRQCSQPYGHWQLCLESLTGYCERNECCKGSICWARHDCCTLCMHLFSSQPDVKNLVPHTPSTARKCADCVVIIGLMSHKFQQCCVIIGSLRRQSLLNGDQHTLFETLAEMCCFPYHLLLSLSSVDIHSHTRS